MSVIFWGFSKKKSLKSNVYIPVFRQEKSLKTIPSFQKCHLRSPMNVWEALPRKKKAAKKPTLVARTPSGQISSSSGLHNFTLVSFPHVERGLAKGRKWENGREKIVTRASFPELHVLAAAGSTSKCVLKEAKNWRDGKRLRWRARFVVVRTAARRQARRRWRGEN